MTTHLDLQLDPQDNSRLANLCGPFNDHLRQIETYMGVEISNRGHQFHIVGNPQNIAQAEDILKSLYAETENDLISATLVSLSLQEHGVPQPAEAISDDIEPEQWNLRLRKCQIKGRGNNQAQYLRSIQLHDLILGVGPAGTGKTYLAVASAVAALEEESVRRLVLVRPAVEAGERLGFLPGDLAQKIDPYLRPIYDALYEMMGFERVAKLIERNVIEIAPLAYMRGRTLNDAFIILDEAQNTTREQMKMFLTRIGFGSTAVVTGDMSQVDLPKGVQSGLRHAIEVLDEVDGVAINLFQARDVVRHPLVQRIVKAYDKNEQQSS